MTIDLHIGPEIDQPPMILLAGDSWGSLVSFLQAKPMTVILAPLKRLPSFRRPRSAKLMTCIFMSSLISVMLRYTVICLSVTFLSDQSFSTVKYLLPVTLSLLVK